MYIIVVEVSASPVVIACRVPRIPIVFLRSLRTATWRALNRQAMLLAILNAPRCFVAKLVGLMTTGSPFPEYPRSPPSRVSTWWVEGDSGQASLRVELCSAANYSGQAGSSQSFSKLFRRGSRIRIVLSVTIHGPRTFGGPLTALPKYSK
jgi:hypothetical protein